MPISRRGLLRHLGATVVAGGAVRSLSEVAFAESSRPFVGSGPSADTILLDHNENAYGPSEKVLAVLRDVSFRGNRYPRAEYDLLLNKLATLHGVKAEQIVLGCGSSEILRLAATACLGPGKKLVQADPTYPTLGRFAQAAGAEIVEVPINKMFEHDLDAMLPRAGDAAGLVYICNPNNPTGTTTPRKDIETFLQKLPANTTVLIDEAYHHFVSPNADYVSFLDHPVGDPRVVVCRTFSKIYGLAGMRVGYAVASSEMAHRLFASRLTYGVGGIAAKAAAAALDSIAYVRLAAKRNADDRQEFANQVNARMFRCLDSSTNFVLVNPMRPPEMIIDHLKKNNVLISPRVSLEKYVRVSLGTQAEIKEFWRVIDLLGPVMAM